MTIKEMRAKTGMSQKAFSEYLGVPKRTIENWESGTNKCPSYVSELIQYKLVNEGKIEDPAEVVE